MGQHKLWSSDTSTLCCVVASAVPKVSQNHSTFIFRVAQPKKRSHALQLDSVSGVMMVASYQQYSDNSWLSTLMTNAYLTTLHSQAWPCRCRPCDPAKCSELLTGNIASQHRAFGLHKQQCLIHYENITMDAVTGQTSDWSKGLHKTCLMILVTLWQKYIQLQQGCVQRVYFRQWTVSSIISIQKHLKLSQKWFFPCQIAIHHLQLFWH